MEALHSGGGQSLDFNVLTCATSGDVVGNHAQYAAVHAVLLDNSGSVSAAAVRAGVTVDTVASGSGAQDKANSNVKLVLGAKATAADGAYNGQILRIYSSDSRATLANAESLHGGNSPHGPKGYKDYLISAWVKDDKLATVSAAFDHGVGQTANDDANAYGAADELDIDYEILPGIACTGTGNIVAVVGRLHVPQV